MPYTLFKHVAKWCLTQKACSSDSNTWRDTGQKLRQRKIRFTHFCDAQGSGSVLPAQLPLGWIFPSASDKRKELVEKRGQTLQAFAGNFSFSPFGRETLKSSSWKALVWPHLPHLLSNFREGLGSNTKPFSFSLSHFPFSQATARIEVCVLPPLFLLLQRQWCLLALCKVKSDFGTILSAVMKITTGRVRGI